MMMNEKSDHMCRRDFLRLCAMTGLGLSVGIGALCRSAASREFSRLMEAGNCVLCSLLVGGPELIDRAASELTAKDFLPHHAVIFRTIMKLRQRGHPVDLIILTQKLRDNDELERIGGASGLTDIFVYLPNAANYARYVGVLKEAAKL